MSSNYLLNKYEIKHDEELLNILNQIKKNEYISSDNKIINRLIKELDENEDLLDVNEIINIKDKVINVEDFNLNTENNENIQILETIETDEIIEDKSKNSQEIIENTNSNKNYILYALPLLVILGAIYFIGTATDKKSISNKEIVEDKNQVLVSKVEPKTENKIIETKEATEEVANVEEKEIIAEKINIEEKTIENEIEEKVETQIANLADTKKDIVEKVEENIEVSSNSEEALNEIENLSNESTIVASTDTPKLKSLTEIDKYIKKLKLEDGKIFYDGNYYSENSMLFGFKVFKITPLYVKFEDVNKKIRKRFLISKK